MIKGIDVARYEPVIDWNKVLDAGYRFAFIKCSQANYNDSKFSEHWENARIAGMVRGAYHFYDPSVHPHTQAEKFYYSLAGDYGELPFVVDIENFTSGPWFGSSNWWSYLEHLADISGHHPTMIYTGYYYWIDNVHRSPAVRDISYFGQYPLWIARYEAPYPLVPPPWTWWMFWQYSETGYVDGVTDQLGRPTKCDQDYFFGSEEQFQQLLDGIPPSGGTDMTTFYRATGNITIRTGPGTTYPQVSEGERYVLTNDIVEISQLQNGFGKIENIYRGDVLQNVADLAWCGTAYLEPTSYTPPTPGNGDDEVKIYVNDVLTVYIKGKLQDV